MNLVPNVHSIYRWKGRVCDDGEFLLFIKTRAREFDGVRETIQKMNTYELPEVLAYRVDDSSPAFAAWIRKATAPAKKRKTPSPRKPPGKRVKGVGLARLGDLDPFTFPMIAFVSLFLGLIVGVVPVTVLVEKPVAAVRYELDGKAVGSVERAPWTLPLDFGAELAPHELVAHALDAAGKEIGVARQFVNLPRPPAEVEVVLERDAKGRADAARFSGQSLLGSRPARVTATFDGAPLPAPESDRVALPAYDDSRRHVLSIELEFTPTVRSRTDVVFGGAESGVVRSELTAVVVRADLAGKVPGGG